MITHYSHMPNCMKVENGSIITPKGFSACGVHAGLRKSRYDLGVILSDVPAEATAVYTQNVFQAAPITLTKDSLAVEGKIQAVIVNSACANACTGRLGYENAYQTRAMVAKKFDLPHYHVAVASTGVIGEQLKMDKMVEGIDKLKPSKHKEEVDAFHEAILTTDLVVKSACYETMIDGEMVTIGGAAKGSGMIHPNMATMLGFVTTDAVIGHDSLLEALREVIDVTFNQITVDGETSTNDMVLVMANGFANHQPLTKEHPDWSKFVYTLKRVCEDLAKKIARDGEGATKLIEASIIGANSDEDANKIAKKIVGSSLVKTAVFGEDANWGRIIGAMGHSEAMIDPEVVDIYIGDFPVLLKSQPNCFSEEILADYLRSEHIHIMVNCNIGEGQGKAWGCDLSYDYVKINASYRT
ncbi:MAG: bifunctional ornithine acetyltransferase/N-acetylglutamate synthase [Bacillaceae bacterium]